MTATTEKVVLLGWDGADWRIIQRLLDEGQLPNLEHLIGEGCMGNLRTMEPVLSPILWTTIATGKTAEEHGIFGFLEPRPDGDGVRPVTSTSVSAPTIWEIVEEAGLKSAVVSWFASYPADRFPGIVVSDMVPNATGASFDEWPMPQRGVSPEPFASVVEALRVHTSDIVGEQILPFIPQAAKIDQKKDPRIAAFAKFLARCATVHAIATHIVEHEDWNLLAVYYETIDRMSHWFMECMPPKMSFVSEQDVDLYQHVVDSTYRFHDMLLGRYRELLGPEASIVICSDHGFYSGDQRPNVSSNMKDGNPVAWHREQGIFLASGPRIRKDELLHGASILDIAPTVLAMLGLPVGRDMDGRVLGQIFDPPLQATYIEKYVREEIPIEVDADESDPWGAQEAIAQLVALGYISPPSKDGAKAVRDTNIIRYHNLAQTFLSKRQYRRAVKSLLEWQALTPRDPRIRLFLARAFLALGKLDDAEVQLVELLGTHAEGPFANTMYGELCLRRGDYDQALAHFRSARDAGHQSPRLHNRIGTMLLRSGNLEEAKISFSRALELDPENAAAFDHLGSTYFRQGDYEESVRYHMRSIGLSYRRPIAHYHLGLALAATGRLQQAVEAFTNSLKQAPNLRPSKEALELLKDKVGAKLVRDAIALYEEYKDDEESLSPSPDDDPNTSAIPHDLLTADVDSTSKLPAITDEIVIVTGLPRSGTSMMMQMLTAGGLSSVDDGERVADDDNPKGYFEHAQVKDLAQDTSLLDDAKGQVVKVIHALLRHLPGHHRYRVIFLRRRLEEVLDSQAKMLARSGKQGAKTDDASLAKLFSGQLLDAQKLLGKQSNCEVLYVDYNETLTSARDTAVKVNDFLGGTLDIDAMADAVDDSLYRQRRAG